MSTYSDQWQEYRRHRRHFLWVFLGYIPGVWLISAPLVRYLNWEHAEMVVALSWMFAFAVVGVRFTCWPCPRCRKWFFASWWYSNQFARKCVHCGLPKWSEGDTEDGSSNQALPTLLPLARQNVTLVVGLERSRCGMDRTVSSKRTRH